ncbi:hypothetical protein D1AOALGA4SA_3350 [Olavius algarvensis Delta 1 endosymbiont]|nr:hypothetical protein D1AOALGA4SA_3350 [Olavius algarvensis Delta 1 endosymbiont]
MRRLYNLRIAAHTMEPDVEPITYDRHFDKIQGLVYTIYPN